MVFDDDQSLSKDWSRLICLETPDYHGCSCDDVTCP